jgi:hypothetical protein
MSIGRPLHVATIHSVHNGGPGLSGESGTRGSTLSDPYLLTIDFHESLESFFFKKNLLVNDKLLTFQCHVKR